MLDFMYVVTKKKIQQKILLVGSTVAQTFAAFMSYRIGGRDCTGDHIHNLPVIPKLIIQVPSNKRMCTEKNHLSPCTHLYHSHSLILRLIHGDEDAKNPKSMT